MNTQMGSALPSEKLDRNKFASWKYKMHQYLVGQVYWSYIKGAHEYQPDPTTLEYATWEQAANCVMYWLVTCIHDHMLGYIREAKTPKEAWENLRKDFRGRHNPKKASTPPRVEQRPTKGHVHHKLHLEGQGVEYECIMAVFTLSLGQSKFRTFL